MLYATYAELSSTALKDDQFYPVIKDRSNINADNYVASSSEDFFHLNTRKNWRKKFNGDFSRDNSNPWKIHISVDFDQLSAAYNIVAPILMQHKLTFKIIDIRTISHENRLCRGAQITIYLDLDEHCKVSFLSGLMEQVTEVLKNNNIGVGVKPRSDAQMTSPYFSMRSDMDYMGEYIPAAVVGQQYNPAGYYNPYESLLTSENQKNLSLIEHFNQFNPVFFDELKDKNIVRQQELNVQYIVVQVLTRYIQRYITLDDFWYRPYSINDKLLMNDIKNIKKFFETKNSRELFMQGTVSDELYEFMQYYNQYVAQKTQECDAIEAINLDEQSSIEASFHFFHSDDLGIQYKLFLKLSQISLENFSKNIKEIIKEIAKTSTMANLLLVYFYNKMNLLFKPKNHYKDSPIFIYCIQFYYSQLKRLSAAKEDAGSQLALDYCREAGIVIPEQDLSNCLKTTVKSLIESALTRKGKSPSETLSQQLTDSFWETKDNALLFAKMYIAIFKTTPRAHSKSMGLTFFRSASIEKHLITQDHQVMNHFYLNQLAISNSDSENSSRSQTLMRLLKELFTHIGTDPEIFSQVPQESDDIKPGLQRA